MTKLNFSDAKEIIRQGILDSIDFKELRAKLPGWRKRPLQSLVFDVMAEMGIKNVPFAGMLLRPRLTRKPTEIDANGSLNIRELLAEKEFLGKTCAAYAHIGDRKITLTIKPITGSPKIAAGKHVTPPAQIARLRQKN
ncbi:hypothetical protein [Desulfovibrio sp. ZJ200]|uniref:hypothetical protein n=1 Tax=Desulfovibrio sp. ZJ200 TaxID=2709792 RepID=UPI0013EA15E1|nr:hypothetical protein [Desulfovibrio sp. ZJ200]